MKLLSTLAAGALIAASLSIAPEARAGEPFLGDVKMVGFSFCPRGFADANGQLLAISQNQALFSILGTTYGGDGRTTFALPDMRSRIPIHHGQGPGLTNRRLGDQTGAETNTLTSANMPSHTHRMGIQSVDLPANSPTPRKNSFAQSPDDKYYSGLSPQGKFMDNNTVVVDPAGSGQAQNNMMPSQTIRYCVATQGVFPSRN